MRVFECRQWEWLACVLVGLLLAYGTHAAARDEPAAHYAITGDEPLEVDLSEADAVRVSLPPGTGHAAVVVRAHFVSLEVRVPEGDGIATLRSVGEAPVLWLFDRAAVGQRDIELVVRDRTALKPHATITLRAVSARELAALATEASVSRLPETPSDAELTRAANAALSAAAQWQRIDAAPETARNLLVAASLLYNAGQFDAARGHARDAATRYDALGDPLAAGLARSAIGLYSIYLDDIETARSTLEQARRALAPRYDGVAVNPAESNLCYLAFRTKAYADAKICYERLIDLATATGNEAALGRYKNLLAGAHWNLGDPLRAEEILRNLLDRPEVAGGSIHRSRWLNNHAITLRALGRPQEALNEYQQALEIARALGDRSLIARVISNLAVVYGDLGAPHQAVDFLAEIHALRKDRGDRLAVLSARNYAGALTDTGRYDEALLLLDEAIELARRIEEREGLAYALRQAAQARIARGDHAAALTLAVEAAGIAGDLENADRLHAFTLVTLGRAQTATGNPGAAIKSLRRSLPLWAAVENPYGEVTARTALGWALRDAGDVAAARNEAMTAVAQIERLRTAIASPDLRASYQSGVSAAYELAVYCEVAEGNPIAALEMAERYRAKTLIDVMTSARSAGDARVPQKLLDARAEALAAINRAEDDRLRGRDAPPVGPLLARLDAIDDEIAAADPATGTRRTPEPIDAAAMRALHAPGDVTLVFFMGRDEGYAWVIDAAGIAIEPLPDANAIGDAARSLHAAVARRSAFGAAADALGKSLLAPLRESLEGAERIAIVNDGALHYVPFDVLTIEGRPTPLQNKPIVYPPSLTTLAISRALPPTGSSGVAVLADPVFSAGDNRVKAGNGTSPPSGARSGAQALNRLRLTRLEADAIRDQAEGIEVTVHMDFDARPAALRGDDIAGANIVHIATHGFADDEIPARSGIALSMVDPDGQPVTGFVGLRDIYGLELDADLVVLSACETALGRDLAGEGLLGLTRGFMFAGARRVVATLWRVEDRATARLMGVFYRELFDGATPAEALATARAALQRDRRFKHPYYWAGFTLQGDWQPRTVR